MKRNNKKSSNLFDLAKTTVKTALWIVIVFALIFLLGRFIYNDLYPAPKIEIQAQGLTDVKLPSGMKNVVCHYSGFTSYFNPETHIPNCVAYEIIESETTGDEPRKKSFEADHTIDGCAESSDYRNSGYDRGHMAPAADMKWSKVAMEESFLMTNICPQVKSLNSGIWHRLEQRVREWAARDSSIIVVCGPIFTPRQAGRADRRDWSGCPPPLLQSPLRPRAQHRNSIHIRQRQSERRAAQICRNNRQRRARNRARPLL